MPHKRLIDDITHISKVLKDDGVILCPTDTIWGLSCIASSEKAVNRIYNIKQRDRNKTFIVLFDSLANALNYIDNIHPRIETLLDYYTKPLTIIHKASEMVPDYLVSASQEVAIRICHHALVQGIIKKTGCPLVSTSANEQGENTPIDYQDIPEKIRSEVDYICLSSREEEGGQSSTIIKYDSDGQLFFLR